MKKSIALSLSSFLITVLSVGIPSAIAQSRPDPTAGQEQAPIDMIADRMEFDQDENILRGFGNVEVRHLGDLLKADYLEVNRETMDVYAKGNVYLEQGGTEWEGEELQYNLETKAGKTGAFQSFTDPYYVLADDSERIDESQIRLTNAKLTTCDDPDPIFYVRARDALLIDGTHLKAKSVTLNFLGVPFFYLPYLSKNVKESNFEFVPGYSSRQGAFLLTRFKYDINEIVEGGIRLDVRSKRGVGVGKDFLWDDDESMEGEFNVYYLNDSEPLEDEDDEEQFGDLVDENRYRVRLQHRQNTTDRDYVVADVNYLSDPLVLEDFFDNEFRKNSQPENRLAWTHRDDYFTAGAELSIRLNDFYDNVNRMPELFLDVQRQQVYETDFYYESENSIGFYERVFADGSAEDDYDAFRADSRHMIFYPTRNFGFLNVIPRVGYRGTYYSKTFDSTIVTNPVTIMMPTVISDTNGTATVTNGVNTIMTNEVTTLVSEDSAALRSLFEIGAEVSFKAFKVLHEEPTIFGDGLRHVAEPFANYTFVPEPNLLPEDLPQFDAIDRLGEQNQLRIGIRNKLQTKNENRIRDLVDAEVFTDLFFDPDSENDFGPLGFDVELMPFRWLEIEFDGAYQFEDEALLEEFNTEIRLKADDESFLSFEHRFRDERRDLLSVNLVLYPQDVWTYGAYARYDNDLGELEEHSYFVQRKGECIGWGLGLRTIRESDGEDDITVWAQLWLTALPETMLDLGR